MIHSGLTRYRRPIFQVALAAADAASACLALSLAILARGRVEQVHGLGPAAQGSPSSARLLILSAIFVAMHAAMGLYRIRRGWSATYLVVSCSVGSCVATALFLACCYLLRDDSISRFVMLAVMAQMAASSTLARVAAREAVRWCLREGIGVKRVVVVGDNGVAAAIRKRILANPHAGLLLVGQAIPREADAGSNAVLRRAGMNDIAAQILRLKPHRVLFAVDIVEHEELQGLAEHCLSHDIEILQVPHLYHGYPGQVAMRELLGMPFLGLGSHGLDGWELILKNIVDRGLAAMALAALSPLLCVIALAVRWSTGGPVLRRSRRAGKGGVPFTLLSFETSRLDQGARVTTPVGAFLIRFGMEGLPQLFNVLVGDMSLVGPIPDTPEGVRRLNDWQRSRLSVKPGMTGLAQMNGRRLGGERTEMIQDDLDYIDSRSLLLDAKILVAAAFRIAGRALKRPPRRARARPAGDHAGPLPGAAIPRSIEPSREATR